MKIAVLISGGGRTLYNLQKYFDVSLVFASSPKVEGIKYAKCPIYFDNVFPLCEESKIDFICLAGYLKLLPIPDNWLGRVLNIHPSLLPAFGGKGMYGMKVHKAVLERGVKFSGCTVHFADNEYDNGKIIVQRTCPVHNNDTPETLAARVFEEEKIAYPEALWILSKNLEKV